MRHALVLAICLLVVTAGCTAPPSEPEGIVLIVVDTLRADHMGLYGYERATTPRLDALAATGSVFEHAFSASAWTLPGMASILTGQYPSVHGAGSGEIRGMRDGVTTLAERLSEAGFATGAVVNVAYMEPAFGMTGGFDSYDIVNAMPVEMRTADESVDRALEWLDGCDSTRPFFLLLHLFDVHHQYNAPPPARGTFTGAFADRYGEAMATAASREAAEQASDGEFLLAAYDEEILWVDMQLERLFGELHERGLRDTTLVALTSDHGEGFGEHNRRGHGNNLHNEVMRVPLVFWGPGVPARRFEEPASTVDIVPTLLDLIGLEVPEVSGGSLRPLMEGGAAPQRPIYARSKHYGQDLEAIVQWPFKLIVNNRTNVIALYDLSTDPGEWHALRSGPEEDRQLTRLARRLRQQIRGIRRAEAGEAVELSPELERQLRALGYIQ